MRLRSQPCRRCFQSLLPIDASNRCFQSLLPACTLSEYGPVGANPLDPDRPHRCVKCLASTAITCSLPDLVGHHENGMRVATPPPSFSLRSNAHPVAHKGNQVESCKPGADVVLGPLIKVPGPHFREESRICKRRSHETSRKQFLLHIATKREKGVANIGAAKVTSHQPAIRAPLQ